MYLKKELYGLIKSDESIFDFIQESALDGLWYWDLENPENEWMNAKFWTVLGYNPDEMPHKSTAWQNIINQDDLKLASDNFTKHCENPNHPYDQVVRYTHKNGSTVWIRCRGMAIRDKDGKPIRMLGAHQDVSDIKNREQELIEAKEKAEESEENLSITLHSIGDGVITTDKFGIIDRMNPMALKLCGWQEDEVKGRPLSEVFNIINAITRGPVSNPVEKVMENGEIVGLANHTVLVARDGREYQIADSAAPIKDKDGNIKGIVLVFSNVSEKYAAEEEIRFQAHITDNSPVITAYHDKELNMVWANKAYQKATGLSLEQIKGRKCYQVWNLTKPCRGCPVTKAIETGENAACELTPVNQENWPETQGYWLSQATPVRDAKGAIIGAIEYALDIKERKQSELLLQNMNEEIAAQNEELNQANVELIAAKEKAEESEEKYRAMYNNAPLSYQSLDENGCFIDINPMWLKTLGYERNEVIGKWYGDFLHPDYVEHFRKNFPAFKKRGYVSDVQFKLRRKDNTFIYVSFEGCIGYTSEGKFKQTYCVFKDITEQKALENALIKAKEKAEESDRLKSSFLANMSHEIRTPMNGILGFTELLREPDLSSKQKEAYIDIVHQSGQRMLNTVNDIVEISKIEAGIVTVNLMEIDVQLRLNELIRFFIPEVTKKGLKLILENEVPKTVALISTDQNKLDSIITNLIKNAIKYTPAGEIRVGCNVHEKMLEFYVKDTGIGIAAERQQAVFERFIQADILNKDARQGSGLGLAIAKSYVEMLGGKIWLESRDGKGSTFYFTLPLTNYEKEKSIVLKEIPVDNENNKVLPATRYLKILIAEDDKPSRDYISIIVNDFNAEVLEAETGIETVELCRNTKDLDLILMDIQMPEMNGYDATREIRKFNKNVIIIAQTAFALAGDYEKALEAGCNGYISKPINKKDLLTLITKNFNNNGSMNEETAVAFMKAGADGKLRL